MSESQKLIELAERCKSATGPNRGLDAMIHFIIKDGVGVGCASDAPPFTGSLDAALSLAPPWSWRVGNLPSGRAFADMGTQKSLQCIEGATPALALTAASLRARAAIAQGDGLHPARLPDPKNLRQG